MLNDQAENLRTVKKNNTVPKNKNKTKTVAIMSGKGGVGKSVITLNSGLQMGKHGKKVLLIDADFTKPSLHILANCSTNYSIEIWLKNKNLLLKEIVTPISSKVDFISSEGIGFSYNLKDWQYTKLLRRVIKESKNYDVVLLDFPTGYYPFMNTIFYELNKIVIISTTEPTSIIDSYSMIKLLSKEVEENKIKVLINQAEHIDDSRISVENLNRALSHFLSLEIEHLPYLPFSTEIRKSIKHQKPVVYEDNSIFIEFFDKLAYCLQDLISS